MKIHRSPPPDGRFLIVRNSVVRDDRLRYLARGLLAELLSHRDELDATADTLAADAQRQRGKPGEGRRAMRAAFAELEAAGYLHRVRTRDAGGHVTTDLHLFDVPTDVPDGGTSVPPAQTRARPGRTDVPLTDVPDGGASTDRRPTDRRPEHSALARFGEFWDVYPRQESRPAAERAWAKAVKRADPAAIIKAAQRYADDPNLPPERFIPYPARWLRDEKWNDGPLPPREDYDDLGQNVDPFTPWEGMPY